MERQNYFDMYNIFITTKGNIDCSIELDYLPVKYMTLPLSDKNCNVYLALLIISQCCNETLDFALQSTWLSSSRIISQLSLLVVQLQLHPECLHCVCVTSFFSLLSAEVKSPSVLKLKLKGFFKCCTRRLCPEDAKACSVLGGLTV